ncbi:(2E,6E)-farnesyl diphosphate synthase [Aquisalimonas lutea]|uniref:(2E,6E)-farnesyl diphosphate synthase n=1 Tax=Aquisalimonas lutea TaxID=1327750 RepID=UPI0025B446D3|nr:farnesyl diphosphate synthase [Aquisalimonas lutea]MDN3517638.1 (2E,6E)-farnesyl diphosphate synthase [Aquisalimonas lutea]
MSNPSSRTPTERLEQRLPAYRDRVEDSLARFLPAPDTLPMRLHEAMRYAVLGSGKRLRPVLVYATGEALGAPAEALDRPACAVELIHAYSLVHDDLPCMDDDDLRRGRPTCHKAYDEATAVLVGDALQSLAFRILAEAPSAVPAEARAEMVARLATAAGSHGMAGGQALDLAATGRTLDLAQLEDLHIHKTGALIRASVMLGALCARAPDRQDLDALDRYAKSIGLAFQIQDDILDVEGTTEALGKTSGADARLDKATYPGLLGMQEARTRGRELVERALDSLEGLGDSADCLRDLARYIMERSS